MFFARAVLQLLADKKTELATNLIAASSTYIADNVTLNAPKPEYCMESSLAVWHLATILTNLASIPPMERVDKRKLFALLMNLYMPIIQYCDASLTSNILEKIGQNCFNYFSLASREQASRNPMDLMKAMFAASSSNPAPKSLSTNTPNIETQRLLEKKIRELKIEGGAKTAAGGAGRPAIGNKPK